MSRHLPPNFVRKARAEFLQELGSDANVQLEPGYNQDEFFDDQFHRRAHEIQRTPGSNNAVNVIPSKQGPWTGNNQLGIERPFSADANNEQTILKMDEWGFPEIWTVMLGLVVDPELVGTDGFSVVARCHAGVGGAQQEFEVDWQNGIAFSTVMNALNVIAFYEDPVGSLAAGLRLRVTLGRGRLSTKAATRTVAISALAGASGDPIVIPPFAARVHFLPNETFFPVTPPTLFYDPSNLIRFQRSLTATDGVVVAGDTFLQFPEGIPIPNGTRTIQFHNGTGSDLSGQAIFSLSL